MTVVDVQVVAESTALALPADATSLDTVSDPGAFLVTALDNTKTWLEQVAPDDLPRIAEEKARATAIEKYVVAKEHGKDAALLAAEIVRRCERAIGELIRQGQAEGTIRKPGDDCRTDLHVDSTQVSPSSIVPQSDLSGNGAGIYQMTDGVSAEEFEAGLAEAKAEKNLSRANVVRKVQKVAGKTDAEGRIEQVRTLAEAGYTSEQMAEHINISAQRCRWIARQNGIAIADDVIGKARRIDSDRIARETVHSLDGLASGVALIDFANLDPAEIEGWVTSLDHSLRLLNRFRKQLKEMTQP